MFYCHITLGSLLTRPASTSWFADLSWLKIVFLAWPNWFQIRPVWPDLSLANIFFLLFSAGWLYIIDLNWPSELVDCRQHKVHSFCAIRIGPGTGTCWVSIDNSGTCLSAKRWSAVQTLITMLKSQSHQWAWESLTAGNQSQSAIQLEYTHPFSTHNGVD